MSYESKSIVVVALNWMEKTTKKQNRYY